jgi:hypothetical protein
MPKVQVHVDPDEGCRGDARSCPIQVAVSRLFPRCRVAVLEHAINIVLPPPWEVHYRVYNPADREQWIRSLDSGFPVREFDFELEFPAEMLSLLAEGTELLSERQEAS